MYSHTQCGFSPLMGCSCFSGLAEQEMKGTEIFVGGLARTTTESKIHEVCFGFMLRDLFGSSSLFFSFLYFWFKFVFSTLSLF